MNIEKMPTPCDLSESSLDFAAASIGALYLHQLHLYASRSDAANARRLQGHHGFTLTIIPNHLLPTSHTWSVEFAGRHIWTEGAC